MVFDVVVTRHPALVEYLREKGFIGEDTKVISHAAVEDIKGKDVCGVLPHSLSCHTASFTEVPLELTPDLRGKELDIDTIRKIAKPMQSYVILPLKL